jgi:tRNA(Ile)-lysidine synthase
MLEKLQQHLIQNFSFFKEKKLLLAVSGGMDSMVLLHAFHQLQFTVGVAHCNFQLRDYESDEDQHFVQSIAKSLAIPIFVKEFETATIANEQKSSIQVTARTLRYDWFYELLTKESYDYIVTAHHLDDSLETFLINLSRGTGLEGLTGIPVQNDKIFRPLLPFSREEIENYAITNNVKWRDDSSNASEKYLRNKFRHSIVPILKEINPTFLDSFQKTLHHLNEAQSIVNDGEQILYREVVTEKENGTLHIDLKKLLLRSNYTAYLYQWLKHYEFTAWNDIYNLVYAQSGKQIFSSAYILLKNRDTLILSKRVDKVENTLFYVNRNQHRVNFPLNLSICNVIDTKDANATTIFVDEEKLVYPLVIRKWKKGDVFQPFGMKAKSKKVSKFFKDEKYSFIDKETTWILCSENKIVWIIGKRQDDRFKVAKTTKNILEIKIN